MNEELMQSNFISLFSIYQYCTNWQFEISILKFFTFIYKKLVFYNIIN